MTFNIIGTGNTAWFMASTLTNAGHHCIGVYGRNIAKATELAASINTKAYSIEEGVADNSDICIIAISDKAITDVVAKLNINKSIVVHTAGAVNIDVLSGFKQGHGVIWPVYSIIKDKLPTARNIPTVWEASDTKARDVITAIAASYTDTIYEANSWQRKWLHLTAVLSNNFANHLFAVSEKLCKEQQLPFSLLLPMIEQTATRIHNSSPYDQQTGPARRNDDAVLQQHAKMLENHIEWQELYISISNSIKEMYK